MEETKKGLLIVVTGPAGSGKGTVLANIVNEGDCAYSVSATTRKPRPGEIDGVNYHFMSVEEFKEHIANNDFLEHAEYVGNHYGTLLSEINGKREKGIHVILELEVQGAANVKRLYPDAVLIWILPPDYATLEGRLRGRATETEEVIQKRMQTAIKELGSFDMFDYIVLNEDGRSYEASRALRAIITAEQHKVSRTDSFVKKFMSTKID